jgi:hypothetical protein
MSQLRPICIIPYFSVQEASKIIKVDVVGSAEEEKALRIMNSNSH